MTKVFITRYALTQGIIEAEGEMTRLGSFRRKDGGCFGETDFKLTLDEAIEKAEDMRRRQIQSLKKRLSKLESLDFTRPNPFEKNP